MQLYLDSNDNSSAEVIFIQPIAGGFQFRVTPKNKHRDRCFASLASVCNAIPGIADHGVKFVKRKEGKVAVYAVEVPAATVLGKGELPAAATESKLYDFVSPLLDAVQNASL